MRNNIVKYVFIVFLIVLAIVVYSFYKRDEKETDKKKSDQAETETTINVVKELRLAIAEYDTINPILSNNRNVQEISKIIYDPLVSINENYRAEGYLAEEVSKTNATSYIVKLREGVKFHDGTNFTSNDVKFTIDAIKGANSVYSENVKHITEVRVIDERTVGFSLDQEVPFFECNLTFPIMSCKYYEGEDFNTSGKNRSPVGTGMFKIASSDENVIRLERNDEYWNQDKRPVLEKVNINFYSNMGEVYNAFKNGNIDIINTDIGNVGKYIGSIGYDSQQYQSKEYDFIALNNNSEVLSNSAVRRAINYSIDKNNVIVSCYGGEYYSSNFPIDYISWIYDGKADNSYNAEEAKNILESDGWAYRNNSWQKAVDGKTVKLSFNLTINRDNGIDDAVAENIKAQLAAVGISVNISRVSSDRYIDMINSKEGYEAIIVNMNTAFSPNINTYLGNGNISNYSNEEMNGLLNEVNNIGEDSTMKEKYKKIVEIYNSDMPFISLARRNKVVIYNTNLVGVSKPTAYNIYSHIERWYRKNY
ncbi:MAG: ABC transporter substrate-binding protein [Clostridia bacterium]|nr:ABC transporter substrate-binding protein [Clostridia bacterium]